ncbi:MAG TPA: M23 family metallopeptidase [Natronosporangium sp.]
MIPVRGTAPLGQRLLLGWLLFARRLAGRWSPGWRLLGRRLLLGCLLLALVVGPAAAPARPAVPAGSVAIARVAGPAPAVPVARTALAPSQWQWPLAGQPTVTRRFDPPPQRWLPGHRGVDLAGTPGAEVLAAGPGTVAFAGLVAGTPVVSIDHPGGLRTTYQPVSPLVERGEVVAAADVIGLLQPGHAGCPAAACLHWGLRRGETYLDPLGLLGLGRVRLLPVAQAG